MKIILASSSPRRIDLMKEAGLRFRIARPDVDETPGRGESPRALVRRLSKLKAFSVARGDALVVAADTIVVAPDGTRVLGKPRNVAEARHMLAMLAGREHTVLTGYCLRFASKRYSRVVCSRVRMRKLSRAEISAYVRSGEPMDKAGAYAAQGLGMTLIESIRGSYTNVVGLPMCQLLMDLENEFGYRAAKALRGRSR